MKQQIDEEVSVVMYFSAKQRIATPHMIMWQNTEYRVGTIGYQHSYMEGRERMHIFELVDKDQTLHFRLRLDCSNLHWTLEAVHDGLAT